MFAKICGITRAEDAQHAVEHGATALGFVFWPQSSRAVTTEQARAIIETLPASIAAVGVFVNASVDDIRRIAAGAALSAVQLHGDESPEMARELTAPVFRSVTLADAEQVIREWPDSATLLLDAADPVRRGGTGVAVDWTKAGAIARARRTVLAGGLTPANVGEAIALVRPFGVDVSSGVESAPGIKDRDKVAAFLANARAAFEIDAECDLSHEGTKTRRGV
jgi:phosphoribosylanthranilate isomerase